MKSLFIGIIVLFAVFSPFIVIWSVNTLFPLLMIPYGLEQWFAMLILIAFFSPSKARAKK